MKKNNNNSRLRKINRKYNAMHMKKEPIEIKDIFLKYPIISLGHNCGPKKYIDKKVAEKEHLVFDYIGTSMWSINELFQNDFVDLFNKEDYIHMQIFDGEESNYLSNSKYYVRFMHDLLLKTNSEKTFELFEEKYKRRIQRLYEFLNTHSKIIFIRYEETYKNRIRYDRYACKLEKLEHEYLDEFVNIIKKKFPNLDPKIIYVRSHDTTETTTSSNKNILTLKLETELNWNNVDIVLEDLFIKNYDSIKKLIDLHH